MSPRTVNLALAIALAYVVGGLTWSAAPAHALNDGGVVRVLTRIAVALEAGNRIRDGR